LAQSYETSSGAPQDSARRTDALTPVSRALKQPILWLTLTYVGLILLMARAYI